MNVLVVVWFVCGVNAVVEMYFVVEVVYFLNVMVVV